MTRTEAVRLVDLLRALWPSKFHWTDELIRTWADGLNKPLWDAEQCEAVIRQIRRESAAKTPTFPQILGRIGEVHRTDRQRDPAGEKPGAVAPEKWAEIFRDRENAAIWWADTVAAGETAEAVRLAGEAFPMFASSFAKFTDPAFRPTPIQCLRLKAAWQWFHDHGPRPKPAHAPGIMAGMPAP